MDEKEITEVPLSNREVLKVLKARINGQKVHSDCEQNSHQKHHPRTIEMIEYLEFIEKGPYKYPLEILRDIKGINADLVTLAIVSNISDLNLLDSADRKKVELHFKKIGRLN